MKKRLGRRLLSLIIAGMLFMNLPINVQAADEITVDFSQFTGGNWWLDSAGNYGSGEKPDDCVFYTNSGGGHVNNGYSVALINVTSNAAIGQDYGKQLYNSGTIVSTDGCIRYTTNYKKGTIIGGTFLNVIMTGGTIKNAIVKGELRCDELDSEYVIENVTLEEGAEIKVIKQGGYEIVANEPGTYTVTVKGEEVTVENETAPEENTTPETNNSSSCDSDNSDSDAEPEKDTNNKKKEKKPEEPKESEEQIFNRELLARAAAAKAGDTFAIDATLWHSFSSDVLKELLSKEGVSYTFYYNYEGECFYITLPAGAVLEEGCEWYGPLKLNAMFGRTMIDKKDLHAAING